MPAEPVPSDNRDAIRPVPEMFEFDVPLTWDSATAETPRVPTSWLSTACKRTEDQESAVRLVFRLYPSGADDLAIQRRIDIVNGGIDQTVDLERGLDNTRQAIMADLRERLYPNDPPDLELSTTDKKTRSQELAAAFMAIGVIACPEEDKVGRILEQRKRAFERMSAIRDRQEIAAQWPVLIQDPPEGWEDLYIMHMSPNHRDAICATFLAARQARMEAVGK